MTKDYKNVPHASDSAKPTSPRKKASANATTKTAKPKKPTPGWVWLLLGLGIGLLVAMIVYLGDRDKITLEQASQAVNDVIKAIPELPALPETAPTAETPAEESKQRFDFYTTLPQLEVIIPDSEIRQEQAKLKPKANVAYMIQAGSFRNYADAESLMAQMALLGVEAKIIRGDKWQRVRSGPYHDKRELNRIRNRLHHNDINTLLITVRTD